MLEGKRIVVVVPCYNEETQIGRVVETMPDYIDKIVIVDDKSADRTVETVQALAEKDDRIVLIRHEFNQGVGGAIASGYEWAAANEIDAAVVMAGDGQMDPEDLPSLLEPVLKGEVDYAKGNRLIVRDAFQKIPTIRFIGNSILSLLTKIASGYWHVADSQCGYTALGMEALKRLNWAKMYRRYGQPNDLLVMLNVYNFKVRDIPVKPVYNIGERSGIKIKKVIFTISLLLLKRFVWRLKEKYVVRDFHPLVFFYFQGALLFAASILLFIRLVILWLIRGYAPEMTAIALMNAFSLGMLSTSLAMWFDMEANKHLR